MIKNILCFKNFNYKLYFSLIFLSLFPALYQTIRTMIISISTDSSVFNVIGQLEWFDLINETLLAFLHIPLYAIFNRVIKNDDDNFPKVTFKVMTVGFILYFLFSIIVYIISRSLIGFMNVNESDIDLVTRYLNLETIAFVIGFIITSVNIVIVSKELYKVFVIFDIVKTLFLVILDFNSELANLSPEDFFKNILVDKLHAKLVVVGQDYKFGSGKSGNTELLSLLGRKYGVDTMFAHKLHDRKGNIISSSRIRELLINGEVDEASRLLSMPYSLEGVIIHGDKRGRQLGYPTINLDVENEMLPLFGVYAAKVMLGGKFYNAMAYVGMRPTINNKMELRVEANIFDFNKEIYGEYAEIILYKYIRGDIKFNSIDELIIQMGKDKEDVSAYLKQVDDYKVNLG